MEIKPQFLRMRLQNPGIANFLHKVLSMVTGTYAICSVGDRPSQSLALHVMFDYD